MYDLIVIGGGPAGTSAAIIAARGGACVLLLERGKFPRHKVCGEFVSAESLGLLECLLADENVALLQSAVRIPQARIFLDGRVLRTAIHPPAASLARFNLDAALWNSARAAGVETREQTGVQSIAGDGPFVVQTCAEELSARAVINASGRWSNLSSAASINRKPHEKWLGLKAHFPEPSPYPSVDLYFFEDGYCGVQPVRLWDPNKEDAVNVCAMVRADRASTLPEVFQLHLALKERSRGWQPLTEPVTTSPLIFHNPQPNRGNVLQAGDTAGFVDPFVGDGISLALRSGRMAAESLLSFFRQETALAAATARYCERYAQELAGVFRASAGIRHMLRLPRRARKPFVFLLEKNPAITRYLVRKTRSSTNG